MSTEVQSAPTVSGSRRARRTTSAHTSVGYLFVAPFLLMFAGLFILPLVYAAYLSLFTERLIGGKAFAGIDNSGQQWSKKISASFRGPETGNRKGAAMSLTSDPAVVIKTGAGDPKCAPEYPYGQTLNLQELNGIAVKLTKFVAGGSDYTDRIPSWFGSTTLPASGALHAKICWQLTTVPVTLAYEIDGIDGSGQQVQSTLNVTFKSPLDTKSGGVFQRIKSFSAWPALAPPEMAMRKAEEQRRATAPQRTPSGMVVAPQPIVGSAAIQLTNRADH